MSLTWGSWQTASGNGMRVGIQATPRAVYNGSTQCIWDIVVYTQNQYSYSDNQTMTYSNGFSGSFGYANNSGSTAVLRNTTTASYNYSTYGTSPGTRTFTAQVSGTFNGITPFVTLTVTIPARPYAAPATPSAVTSVRVNDSQDNVNWTNHATTGAPYSSITLQRRDYSGTSWSAWGRYFQTTLSGAATGYAMTGLIANRVFEYQVQANNAAGSSGFYAGPTVPHTPAAPNASPVAAVSGSNIVVFWTYSGYVPAGGVTFNIQRNVAGAGFVTLATNVTTPYTDTSPGGSTNQYQVDVNYAGLASAWTQSNTVSTGVTPVVPLAPTMLSPTGLTFDAYNLGASLTWQHNPGADFAAQTAFKLQFSSDGGVTWSVTVASATSATSAYALPASTLADGLTWQWQVATEGNPTPGFGPWSASATIIAVSPPPPPSPPGGPDYVVNQEVRVQVGFQNGARDPLASVAWYDVTPDVKLAKGITFNRGRDYVDTNVNPGRIQFTLDNVARPDRGAVDGRYTVGNTAGPYDPLQIRTPVQVLVRQAGDGPGNLLCFLNTNGTVNSEDASFESPGVGNWISTGTLATLANSSAQAQVGTESMLVTWPSDVAGASVVQNTLAGFVIGRTYTFSAYVWVASGPAVTLSAAGQTCSAPVGSISTTSTTGSFQRVATTFVANAATIVLSLTTAGSSTSGQTCYIDALQVDEGILPVTFIASPIPLHPMWTGHVDAWNSGWAGGILPECLVTGTDRFARMSFTSMKTLVSMMIMYYDPLNYWPLDDSAGSIAGGNLVATDPFGQPLTIAPGSAGGSLTFGVASTVGPDSDTCVQFTPVALNFKYLTSVLSSRRLPSGGGSILGWTSMAFIQPAAVGTLFLNACVFVSTGGASHIIAVNSAGYPVVEYFDPLTGLTTNLTGISILSTTTPTHIAVQMTAPVSGSFNVYFYVNGVVQPSYATITAAANPATWYTYVGGADFPNPFNGLISHVAEFDFDLNQGATSGGAIYDIAQSMNGYVGESTDLRWHRICEVSGYPSPDSTVLGNTSSYMAPQGTDKQSGLSALQIIADAEAGLAYVQANGVITLAARSTRYNESSVFSIPAIALDASTLFTTDDTKLVNDATATRPAGATQRSTNQDSVDQFGQHPLNSTIYVSTDVAVLSNVQWQTNTRSTPAPRVGAMIVDLVSKAASIPDMGVLLDADMGDRFSVDSLPTDSAPSVSLDLFLEGVSDNITHTSWARTFNGSPVGLSGTVWVVEDPSFGAIDATSVIAF